MTKAGSGVRSTQSGIVGPLLVWLLVMILSGGGIVHAADDDRPAIDCLDPDGEPATVLEGGELPAYCGPSESDGADGSDDGGSGTRTSGAADPVRGYFNALLDRRIDDLATYVCDTTTWHSLLGSPAYGIDPRAWWSVLKFTPDGALRITVKGKTPARETMAGGSDPVKKPSEDADKFERDIELEKKLELEGVDKTEADPGSSGAGPDKFDEPFDPDKKPREGFDDSVKPEDLGIVDPDKKPLDGETASDDDKFDEPFDPDKTPIDPDETLVDPFDPDKVPIDARAVVQVKGKMIIGVGSRSGVKRQLRRSLEKRFGRTPPLLAVDRAVSELAKGRRVSLNQDVPVARVAGGDWLICPEVVDTAKRKGGAAGGGTGKDAKKKRGKKARKE